MFNNWVWFIPTISHLSKKTHLVVRTDIYSTKRFNQSSKNALFFVFDRPQREEK